MLKIKRINQFRQRSLVLDLEANAKIQIGKAEAAKNRDVMGREQYALSVGTYEVILDSEVFTGQESFKQIFPQNGIILHGQSSYFVDGEPAFLMTVTNGFLSISAGTVINEDEDVELSPDAMDILAKKIASGEIQNEPQSETETVPETPAEPSWKWWHDGNGNEVKSVECPGEGWVRGKPSSARKK